MKRELTIAAIIFVTALAAILVLQSTVLQTTKAGSDAPTRGEITTMLRKLDVQINVDNDGKVNRIGPVDRQWNSIKEEYPEMEQWIAKRFPELKREIRYMMTEWNGMKVCREETLWERSK